MPREVSLILVTGAGGKTGLAVVRALHAVGASVRALIHHEPSVGQARAAGAEETVVGDMGNRAEIRAALHGVRTVYAISPNMAPDEFDLVAALIDAAVHEDVDRFVYHSVLHPQTEKMPHHWQKMRVEERLLESGLPFTILQPAAYMQNLKGYWDDVVGQGIYRIPYPVATRLSLVDLEDVAQAAATVLTQDGHAGATYELCGPRALSQVDVARTLGQVIGREVEAQEMQLEAWLARPQSQALGDHARRTLVAMFGYYASYGLAGNPNILSWLLGRPPTDLADVLRRDFLGQN